MKNSHRMSTLGTMVMKVLIAGSIATAPVSLLSDMITPTIACADSVTIADLPTEAGNELRLENYSGTNPVNWLGLSIRLNDGGGTNYLTTGDWHVVGHIGDIPIDSNCPMDIYGSWELVSANEGTEIYDKIAALTEDETGDAIIELTISCHNNKYTVGPCALNSLRKYESGCGYATYTLSGSVHVHDASVGSQTGSGQTDLTMILEDAREHGGTAEPEFLEDGITPNPSYNPDTDNDSYGDNLAFTVPSAINYVVKADGSLVGPAEGVAYIENKSAFGVHVSSLDVDSETGFNFVADATTSNETNSVDLQMGPALDMLQASDYLTKNTVNDATKWNMTAASGTDSSKVLLKTEGNVAHIDKDLTSQTKFGTAKWYVTPGLA